MHMVGSLVGRADTEVYLVAGLLLTNVALLVALGYLVALVRQSFPTAIAARTALYLLVFPSSLFLSAVYPHSLFLACALASFYYARQGRWWLAAALGCAASLTRLQAAALVVPLAYEYLAQRQFDLRRIRVNVLALALVPVGCIAFLAYLFVLTGDPLAALNAGSAWHRQLMWPWEVLQPFVLDPLGTHGWHGTAADFGYTILLLALTALSWRHVPRSLAVYGTTFAVVIVSSGILVSSMRYALELFPIFITLAILGRKPLFHRAYLAVAILNGLKLMSLFALGEWIA
jgi:hypothetical protein